MKLNISYLMKKRGGSSNNYDCPIHIRPESCMKLYEEAGAKPESGAVGALGDVLENFAIAIIKNAGCKKVSVLDLEQSLKNILSL